MNTRRLASRPIYFEKNAYSDPEDSVDAKQGMVAAYATGDYTLQAVADAFGVHYSTVSRAINGK